MRGSVLGLGMLVALAGSAMAQQPLPRRSAVALPSIGVDSRTGAELFGRVWAVAVAPSDTLIYVLDYAEKNIKVVTRAGVLVRTISRRGGGPGELQSPLTLRIVRNEIEVIDQQKGRVRFSLTGRSLGQSRSDPWASYRLSTGATLQQERAASRLDRGVFPFAVTIALRNGRRDTVAVLGSSRVQFRESSGRMMELSSSLGPYGAFTVFNDSLVVVANGHTGRVDWYRPVPSGLQRMNTFSLPVVPTRISRSELEQATRGAASQYFTMATDGSTRGGATNRGTIESPPQFWPVANQVVMSNDGAAWIGARRRVSMRVGKLYESTVTNNEWFVVGPEGPRYTVTLPPTFSLQAVMGDLLIGTHPDGDDVELQLMRVQR